MAGKVYLIGAGPGDTGLITKKGYECLKKSNVVVYDRLVNKDLLSDLDENTKFIYVGKTAHNHTKTQDEINEILYNEARDGNIVARLKGGDPYVFGRGGEEGEYLYDRNIEFEEIPGITSAIGGLAYAGIPITHRGIATSFHVITGHLKDDKDDLNWNALANLEGTLVFLMGVSNLKKITDNLINEGKKPNTKAAIINWGTTTKQKVVEGNLSNIYKLAVNANIQPPSLIVIGDVVSLRKKLNFFERKPLFGKNIIITRESKYAQSTINKFKELGANVISFPTIRTKTISNNINLYNAIKNIGKYNYIIFTSVNSVNIFFNELFNQGFDSRALSGIKIAVIGPKTKNAVKNFGIIPEIIPNKYVAEDLVDVLKPVLSVSDNVLIPKSKISRPLIVDELKNICNIYPIDIYETSMDNSHSLNILNDLKYFDEYFLVFTSSSTFDNFTNVLGDESKAILEKANILSIGPITTKTIESNGYKVYKEADEYTIDGIIKVLMEEYNGEN